MTKPLKRTQVQRVLDALADAHPEYVPMSVLNNICYRYGGRLHDLKRRGIEWDKWRRADGAWYYWLVTKPGQIDFEKCRLKEAK